MDPASIRPMLPAPERAPRPRSAADGKSRPPRRNQRREIVPALASPIIEPGAATQRDRAKLRAGFGEGAAGPGLAARPPAPRRIARGISEQLARLSAGAPSVAAEPQLESQRHWRAHLGASAD